MPTVTVQIVDIPRCSGANHVEVRTFVDGVRVSTEVRTKQDLLESATVVDQFVAKERILKETEAGDFATYRVAVEAKSETIRSASPGQSASESGLQGIR